jgi:hypothetical protein
MTSFEGDGHVTRPAEGIRLGEASACDSAVKMRRGRGSFAEKFKKQDAQENRCAGLLVHKIMLSSPSAYVA